MIGIPLILPFIPAIVWWGAVALVGTLTVAGASGAFKNPKKNKLGVLGMEGAGKTRFLSFMRGVPFKEDSTDRKPYAEFQYKMNNDKSIYVSKGMDFGGSDIYRSEYNSVLDNSDVTLYFFNIDCYLRDVKILPNGLGYQRECNSRFEHIYSAVKGTEKDVIVIATHKDKCHLLESEMKKRFDALTQNKNYQSMLNEVAYVDLTNDSELSKLVNEIFS